MRINFEGVSSGAAYMSADSQPEHGPAKPDESFPRRACNDRSSPHYFHDCARLGLIVNGRTRVDVIEYDMDNKWVRTKNGVEHVTSIQPYWRKTARVGMLNGTTKVGVEMGPKPLGKRAKRRLRGKAKAAR